MKHREFNNERRQRGKKGKIGKIIPHRCEVRIDKMAVGSQMGKFSVF